MTDETKGLSVDADDLAQEMIREAIIAKAMGDAPAAPKAPVAMPAPRGKVAVAEEEDPEADEVVDLGDYCVECRFDSEGQEGRTPALIPSARISQGTGPDGEDEVISVLLKGFKCENCQPFEQPLFEDALEALAESTRRDRGEIRNKMRQAGTEPLWAEFFGPMLERMETALGLDIE
jgi:hypothetical protein